MKLKKVISVMLVGACVFSMAACGSKKEEAKKIESADDLKDAKIGVQKGKTGEIYCYDDLGEENLKYGMFIFIELFWNRIKKNRNIKKSIYLDEIWRLIGVTSNKEVASFINKIFKTIRKYGGSSVAITQDISDLFSLENGTYGKSILNNSSIKTFFSLEEENPMIQWLKDHD